MIGVERVTLKVSISALVKQLNSCFGFSFQRMCIAVPLRSVVASLVQWILIAPQPWHYISKMSGVTARRTEPRNQEAQPEVRFLVWLVTPSQELHTWAVDIAHCRAEHT